MIHTLNKTEFIIHQAKFAIVSAEWSKRYFPYPHHRLYYVTEGEAQLKLQDREIKLLPGHIYLLPAHMLLEAICPVRLGHYYIHFHAISEAGHELYEFYQPSIMEKAAAHTPSLYQHIFNDYRSSSLSSVLTVQGALRMLLAPFFSNVQIDPSKKRLHAVLAYIQHNYTSKIKLQTLADLLELDSVYFSNLFKQTMGVPPSQYIINKRIEAAQRHLSTSNLRIKDIAYETGFENEMYFSRIFRLKTGISPGQYRQQFSEFQLQ